MAAACAALCAALGLVLLAARPSAALAGTRPVRHVVIVGISGLRWIFATPATTPALWRLAEGGSVGALVDYAQQPVACPDDGWLTLNGGARAEGPRPCAALPPVLSEGTGARIPAMPEIIRYNEQFHESPDWGLLQPGRLRHGRRARGRTRGRRAVRRRRSVPPVCQPAHRYGAGSLSADRSRSWRAQFS